MFYESVVKVKELKTVSLPRNKPKMINWTTEPAIANYQQYMDEFLKIREETETFIQGLLFNQGRGRCERFATQFVLQSCAIGCVAERAVERNRNISDLPQLKE